MTIENIIMQKFNLDLELFINNLKQIREFIALAYDYTCNTCY